MEEEIKTKKNEDETQRQKQEQYYGDLSDGFGRVA